MQEIFLTSRRKQGFTLVELLVVVLIIGILAAVAIPQYKKTIETSYADSAVSLMNSIGTANRMYSLDNSGTFTSGTFSDTCLTTDNACPSSVTNSSPCNLMSCKYIANQSFKNNPYSFAAVNGPDKAGTCPFALSGCLVAGGATFTVANMVVCAARCNGAAPCTNSTPYKNWAYAMDSNGVVAACGGAPTPPS